MSVQVLYGDVFVLFPALGEFAGKPVVGASGMRLSLALRGLVRELSPVAEDIEITVNNMYKEYADKDEKGKLIVKDNQLHFSGENAVEFAKLRHALMSNTLDVTKTISAQVLVDGSDWLGEVSGNFVDAICPFVVD